eukprot:scaffold8901_cov115-Isochrysis_galbana.AAC.3
MLHVHDDVALALLDLPGELVDAQHGEEVERAGQLPERRGRLDLQLLPVLVSQGDQRHGAGGDASEPDALGHADGQHPGCGGQVGQHVATVDGQAVLELGRVEHRDARRDEHARQRRHRHGGHVVGEEGHAAEDEAGLHQRRQPRIGLELDVQAGPGDDGRHRHAHEGGRGHVGHALPDELLCGEGKVGGVWRDKADWVKRRRREASVVAWSLRGFAGLQSREKPGLQTGEKPRLQMGEEPCLQIGEESGLQTGEKPGLQKGEEPGL